MVPKVVWVDERSGVLGMERVEGWRMREILGGGAGGEGEVQEEEGEVEFDPDDGLERLDLQQDGVEEETEGMKALSRLGVTQGISLHCHWSE